MNSMLVAIKLAQDCCPTSLSPAVESCLNHTWHAKRCLFSFPDYFSGVAAEVLLYIFEQAVG